MNSPATKEQLAEGPVVAVQYPSEVIYSSNAATELDLIEKYGHLKQLDPKDKGKYKELKAAIVDVSGLRTQCSKEEDVIKKPLNEFRALVISTGKEIRGGIQKIEDFLKAEKKRIDDIRAEALAAQQRLHNTNLQAIHKLGNDSVGLPVDKLEGHLASIDAINLDDLDYGDLLEEAKAALANARIIAEQAIEQEKQRLKLVAQQVQLDLEAEQRRLDDAKRELEQAHESAIHENEMFDMRAKLAASEANNTPEPAAPSVSDVDTVGDKSFAESMGISGRSNIGSNPTKMIPDMIPGVSKVMVDGKTIIFEGDPALVVITIDDAMNMSDFIRKLQAAIDSAPANFKNQDYASAVNRVVANLGQAVNFLKGVEK